MAWLVFCKFCGASFRASKERSLPQSPEGELVLKCDNCGKIGNYTASDVLRATSAAASAN